MTASLIEFPKNDLRDVAGVLRAIADQIEAGEYAGIDAAALVLEDEFGNIRIFGAGMADYYRAFALFHFGIEHLLAARGREHMV